MVHDHRMQGDLSEHRKNSEGLQRASTSTSKQEQVASISTASPQGQGLPCKR